jgi:hypothetical protein
VHSIVVGENKISRVIGIGYANLFVNIGGITPYSSVRIVLYKIVRQGVDGFMVGEGNGSIFAR